MERKRLPEKGLEENDNMSSLGKFEICEKSASYEKQVEAKTACRTLGDEEER